MQANFLSFFFFSRTQAWDIPESQGPTPSHQPRPFKLPWVFVNSRRPHRYLVVSLTVQGIHALKSVFTWSVSLKTGRRGTRGGLPRCDVSYLRFKFCFFQNFLNFSLRILSIKAYTIISQGQNQNSSKSPKTTKS